MVGNPHIIVIFHFECDKTECINPIRFKEMIDCEYIVVFTFDASLSVSSFRTIALPRDMENYKKELERQYLAKLLEKQQNLDTQDNQGLNYIFY